jgi:uncharacterized protein YggU (UPF0235/DUF167 family)
MPEPRKAGRNKPEVRFSTVIVIRVIPRSSKIAISQEGPSSFKVRLTTAPVDGAANRQLLSILAEKLLLPVRHVRLISGQTARIKRIEIEGLDPSQIADRLS